MSKSRTPAHPRWRYTVLIIAAVTAFVSGGFLALFDPYAIYGRITASGFSPIWRLGNNQLAEWAEEKGSDAFYPVELLPIGLTATLCGLVCFGILIFLSVRYGRLYCNTFCPVGTFFGMIGKHSFFRIRIDSSECVSCRICEKRCKTGCIDAVNKTIDNSRCVVCFDCLKGCPKSAISWSGPKRSFPVNDSSDEYHHHHHHHRENRFRQQYYIDPMGTLGNDQPAVDISAEERMAEGHLGREFLRRGLLRRERSRRESLSRETSNRESSSRESSGQGHFCRDRLGREHSRREHSRREHSRRDFSGRDYSSREYSERGHSDHKHSRHEHLSREYSGQEQSEREHSSREHSRRGHLSREHSSSGHRSSIQSKRQFFSTLGLISTAFFGLFSPKKSSADEVPEISYNGNVPYKRQYALTPPGSRSLQHFQAHCISCHLCVSKCPSKAIRPAIKEYGPLGFLQPTLVFDVEKFCNYDCTICGEVCPAGAIQPLTVEEKHKTQIGQVEFIKENCVVVTDGTNCGACGEHCPTQAIRMVPYEGALTIPEIHPELCVGCGACESICPVRPFRAVHVEGLPVHQEAQEPPKTESEDVKVEDFGF